MSVGYTFKGMLYPEDYDEISKSIDERISDNEDRFDHVVFRIIRKDGRADLSFTIGDTGIGMSHDYLPRIYDTFSQEDSTVTNKYGSTGLGLPITNIIVSGVLVES